MSKPKTQRPESVKVRHLRYVVTWTDQPIICENKLCHGLCDSTQEKIDVTTGLPPRQAAETWLHEVVHALNEEEGITDESIKLLTEEAFTIKVSKMFCTLTADNPSAVRWFMEQFE